MEAAGIPDGVARYDSSAQTRQHVTQHCRPLTITFVAETTIFTIKPSFLQCFRENSDESLRCLRSERELNSRLHQRGFASDRQACR
jgi:hypothetical protein